MSGGASEKAAAMMVLLLTAALLPMLVEYFMNYERKKQEEETERQAITAAEVTLRVRRQLDGQDRPSGDEDTAPKRRRRSRIRHQCARLAVQEDYFSPTPVFDDRQNEHIFRMTKQMTQHILNICAITDHFSLRNRMSAEGTTLTLLLKF